MTDSQQGKSLGLLPNLKPTSAGALNHQTEKTHKINISYADYFCLPGLKPDSGIIRRVSFDHNHFAGQILPYPINNSIICGKYLYSNYWNQYVFVG